LTACHEWAKLAHHLVKGARKTVEVSVSPWKKLLTLFIDARLLARSMMVRALGAFGAATLKPSTQIEIRSLFSFLAPERPKRELLLARSLPLPGNLP
jgi:hypothetical protein